MNVLSNLRKIGKSIERGDNNYEGNLANEYANDVWSVYTYIENKTNGFQDIDDNGQNAIDAMRGKGKLAVAITVEGEFVKINVTDSGKGIPKKQFKNIFEPGFTTKKRGWGLGLSLTKRIVEEYHDGKIKVLQSEKDKGTTMQIALKSI